ncbi:MAG TPA: hypothetical protein VIL72_15015 [Beijerinckiaceae bacterium]
MDSARVGRVAPFLHWLPCPRVFLMARALFDEFHARRRDEDPAISARWARLHADIDHFITGGFVTADQIKRLEPAKQEVWELRSPRPRPGLRIFGRFARPDVFLATHAAERKTLGSKWSLEFELAKLRCEETWRELVGTSLPYAGSRYEDYITENARETLRIEP